MTHGLAYDSDGGRQVAGAITALMHGPGKRDQRLACGRVGPFAGYKGNEQPMNRVLDKHRAALVDIAPREGQAMPPLYHEAYRQAQASGTGSAATSSIRTATATHRYSAGAHRTISFFMDAVTTGVEPELSLIKYKNLVDGSVLTIVNPLVRRSLEYMKVAPEVIERAEKHIEEHGNLEDFADLSDEQKKIFATSLGQPGNLTTLSPESHVRMMAATQPFLSGAISKTVNMPSDSTVEDIEKIYFDAWKMGLKSIAIYRDGCKRSQPLEGKGAKKTTPTEVATVPKRKRLPTSRKAITHKFDIAGHEGVPDRGHVRGRQPGRGIHTDAQGGFDPFRPAGCVRIVTSIALQYGAPLEVLVDKMTHMRFEPAGMTKNRQIPIAKSLVDYIFRYLAIEFMDAEKQQSLGIKHIKSNSEVLEALAKPKDESLSLEAVESEAKGQKTFDLFGDAPSCDNCGTLMERRGSCYTCPSCGDTTGCS